MAYRTYTTRALVLHTYERVGSDKTIQLFTEEAGMLFARATGVRYEKSKMRYALQPFSLVRITLVKGKAEWRIVGAEPLRNVFFDATDRMARLAVRECVTLISRFVKGEERHARLFALMEEGIRHIALSPSEDALIALRLRLLHELGYVAPADTVLEVCEASTLEEATSLFATEKDRAHALTSIAAALSASHL